MSQINTALTLAQSPTYSIDQILQSTQPTTQPSGFRRVLGAVVGGVGNIFAPGIGGLIGSAISGAGGINQTGLMGSSTQFLQLQQQMNMEQEAFETASSVMKSRHDASMSAIRNIS
jgi:hypothetical protein